MKNDVQPSKMFNVFIWQDLKHQLVKLQKQYEAWEKDLIKNVPKGDLTQLSDKKKKKLEKDRQKRRQQAQNILEQALVYKFECEMSLITLFCFI